MLQTIRKRLNNKGFTLVELIVVLVILAILAALLIPSLTGYIDRARQESIVAETRMVVMAAQTVLSEDYGQGEIELNASGDTTFSYPYVESTTGQANDATEDNETPPPYAKTVVDEIHKLSETNGDFKITCNNKAKITKVEYSNSGYICTYTYNETTGESSYVCNSIAPSEQANLIGTIENSGNGYSTEIAFA